jgi:predicted enzyme related to lactoylglutathione lyase
VITAVHSLVYAEDADAARAFFRDVVGWPHVDSGGGWLIFRTGVAELGVHPGQPGTRHEISLMCDDIADTIAEWMGKGVEFTREIRDDGFGLTVTFLVPGAGEMQLYQPLHPTAFDLPTT